MSVLYTASNYKNTIVSLLLRNPDFVSLINPQNPPHELLSTDDMLLGGKWIFNGKKYTEQGHVFDYNFVDDTTVQEKTFVFVETDIDSIYQENTFADYNLYVCIFTSKNLVRITDDTIPSINDVEMMGYNAGHYGNRIDILCDIVDRTLMGSTKIRGIGDLRRFKRGFCSIYTPSNKYYGKCLKYNVTNLNEVKNECENR